MLTAKLLQQRNLDGPRDVRLQQPGRLAVRVLESEYPELAVLPEAVAAVFVNPTGSSIYYPLLVDRIKSYPILRYRCGSLCLCSWCCNLSSGTFIVWNVTVALHMVIC